MASVPTAVESAEIASLLERSLDAHRRAQVARNKREANAADLLLEARNLRVKADALDPQHTAQAWADEQGATPKHKDTHQALMNFYARQIW